MVWDLGLALSYGAYPATAGRRLPLGSEGRLISSTCRRSQRRAADSTTSSERDDQCGGYASELCFPHSLSLRLQDHPSARPSDAASLVNKFNKPSDPSNIPSTDSSFPCIRLCPREQHQHANNTARPASIMINTYTRSIACFRCTTQQSSRCLSRGSTRRDSQDLGYKVCAMRWLILDGMKMTADVVENA